jgi:class 3 adenylate cyclase
LAEKILTSKAALEGERKQVTVLFADLKGSMELLADRDPEEARALLDPVLERMRAVMHRSEGNANPFTGDGAEGCSNSWAGSGAARELDGPWCTSG